PYARAIAEREQDSRYRHAEEEERPRLRLCGDCRERPKDEQRCLVRQQVAVQGPPTGQGIPPHLIRNEEVDKRDVDEVLRDRGDPDRPWLASDLSAGTCKEDECS